MANTFKKIQTVTVGAGGASSIDFTSIPQTFTDLKIVLSARTNRASSVTDFLSITFNGSTTNRSGRELFGTGTGAGSGTVSILGGGLIVGSTATASVFGSTEIYIPNYTSANNKSLSVDSVSENNGSEAYQDLLANLWANTAAITSISIFSNNSANFVQYSTATLYGVANVPAAGNAKATGGIITYDDTYVYHTFPWSGTFTPLTSLTADYLVVAGGGGGGSYGGGGGAGGTRCTVGATGGGGSLESALSLTATAYTVTVGAGGAKSPSGLQDGVSGSNSVFSTITSTGGGGGGGSAGYGGNPGLNGGCGGGGGINALSATTEAGGTASPSGQGYGGGTGVGSTSNDRAGGGGGGANAVGANGSGDDGGNGGNGITTSISGTSTIYAGGGGGGTDGRGASPTGGTGGTGGGGAGGTAGGTSGTANRGGGGGGGGFSGGAPQDGGAGSSGIVIVRYAK